MSRGQKKQVSRNHGTGKVDVNSGNQEGAEQPAEAPEQRKSPEHPPIDVAEQGMRRAGNRSRHDFGRVDVRARQRWRHAERDQKGR